MPSLVISSSRQCKYMPLLVISSSRQLLPYAFIGYFSRQCKYMPLVDI